MRKQLVKNHDQKIGYVQKAEAHSWLNPPAESWVAISYLGHMLLPTKKRAVETLIALDEWRTNLGIQKEGNDND